MKKSQILAALALAFALGVAVIPSANTYAYVVGTNSDGKEVTITGSKTLTDLNKAITDAKATKNATDYTNYSGLIEALNGDAQISVGSPAADTTLNDVYDDQADNLLTAINTADAKFDQNAWKNKGYANILAEAKTRRDAAKNTQNGTNTTEYTTLNNAVEAAEAAVAEAEKATVELIQTDLQTNFKYTGNYLVSNYVTEKDGKTEVNFSGAVAYAKNQAPEYGFYSNLVAAVEKAEDVVAVKNADDTNKYTEAQAAAALVALQNAIEGKTTPNTDGTGEGTNKPGEGDNNGGNKAPDTGILANAEGNASTTVAMVAGIATALTAAGAGVVAYRNARRSSRK